MKADAPLTIRLMPSPERVARDALNRARAGNLHMAVARLLERAALPDMPPRPRVPACYMQQAMSIFDDMAMRAELVRLLAA